MARIVTHTALEEMMLVVITNVMRTQETKSVWLDGWDPAVLLVSIQRILHGRAGIQILSSSAESISHECMSAYYYIDTDEISS